jgi:hypothetical protein
VSVVEADGVLENVVLNVTQLEVVTDEVAEFENVDDIVGEGE